MGLRKPNGPGYRTERFVRGDGKLMSETIRDPAGLLVYAYEADDESAAEMAGATDTAARAAEDNMDAYEQLLRLGARPIIVLCRAATRRPAPQEYYGATATELHKLGGLTSTDQKHRRKIVKRWCEGGLGAVVPQHCWALLLSKLPASLLKERLTTIGKGGRS